MSYVGNAIQKVEIQGVGGANSASNPLSVTSSGYTSGVGITRPNNMTTYAAGEVIGDANGSAIVEFQNIGPSGGQIYITSGYLRIDIAAIPTNMSSFRLHLYDSAPTAIADNVAWDLVSGDRVKYKGFIDLGSPADFGSTLYCQVDQINKQIGLATGSTSLFGLLVTNGGIVPAAGSEVYNLRLRSVGV